MQHLLKQVSWTTNRMANPDRGRVYQDMDEKMEACLEYSITWGHSDDKIEPGESPKKHVWYDSCPDECGTTPDDKTARYSSVSRKEQGGGEGGQGQKRMGNGSYAYCSCCAEMSQTLNALSDKGGGGEGGEGGGEIREPVELEGENIDKRELFTLAERAFYGLHSKSDKGEENSIDRGLQMFKRVYGDIVLNTEEVESTANDTSLAPSEVVSFGYRYQMPKWSPQKLVALYRNRCNHSEKPSASTLTSSGMCHDDEDEKDFGVKYGVCPSLWYILKNWQKILQLSSNEEGQGQEGGLEDWKRKWAEASMGQPLNGHNIKALLHLHGDSPTSIDKPVLVLARVLESYCDAAAIGALTRKHSMLKAHFLDMLTLSQSMTSVEKQRLVNLMERYTHYLRVAEADVSSKFMAQASLSG